MNNCGPPLSYIFTLPLCMSACFSGGDHSIVLLQHLPEIQHQQDVEATCSVNDHATYSNDVEGAWSLKKSPSLSPRLQLLNTLDSRQIVVSPSSTCSSQIMVDSRQDF
jgi:hypothetical protein